MLRIDKLRNLSNQPFHLGPHSESGRGDVEQHCVTRRELGLKGPAPVGLSPGLVELPEPDQGSCQPPNIFRASWSQLHGLFQEESGLLQVPLPAMSESDPRQDGCIAW